ncbi:4Fe-4S dicluster domain-containing protein [Natranaerofaba carboxydovora]|uniref:4Fe-4S dicluster domain-containing protein n=1 Tax=Natranaerofaba carboxydovora TaxID=2742683 RepID=UPI001F143E51|nr:4Fe-4S dicluster domain-containing protein [Natranaerofaba carboxydovora]UMZ72501.1 Ferredoxin-2 [Natranaerofaba carboxydovora]
MGHLGTNKEAVYKALAKKIDSHPPGAPNNETLLHILKCLYTEEEASLGAKFPRFISSFNSLQKKTSLSQSELKKHLNNMINKGLVTDLNAEGKDDQYYMLTPMVVGFFEYTFMRTTSNLPLKDLSELFEEYLTNKEVVQEIFGGETKFFRASTHQKHIPLEIETEVFDYEKAADLIKDAGKGAITTCSCRHKAWHLGKNCDAPMDVCTSLGSAAEWVVEKGFGRPAGTDELLRILDETQEKGLVHLVDNVEKNPFYLCHCCGCCCGVLRAINEHEVHSVIPSNFIPHIDSQNCNGCGNCSKKCHINAVEIIEQSQANKNGKTAKIIEDLCIGCGACIDGCNKNAILLVRRDKIYTPPKNKKDQTIKMAKEKGKTL